MLAIVKSLALSGLEGYIIQVEVDVANGLPAFEIVGTFPLRQIYQRNR